MTTIMLASGDPLADVEREAEHGIAFARTVGLGRVIDILITQLGLVTTLREMTPNFGTFDDRSEQPQRSVLGSAADISSAVPQDRKLGDTLGQGRRTSSEKFNANATIPRRPVGEH